MKNIVGCKLKKKCDDLDGPGSGDFQKGRVRGLGLGDGLSMVASPLQDGIHR